MPRRNKTAPPARQAKAALVYAPSAVSQHGNFMNIGVAVVSCTAKIWDGIRLFRAALQLKLGINGYRFRRVRDDQFIVTLRPHVRSTERLQDMAKTITELITEYLGITFVRHRQFATQAQVDAILA